MSESGDRPLRVGSIFHGYCAGYFGRDGFGDKRVEAIGADWIVCRYVESGYPTSVSFRSPQELAERTTEWLHEPPEPTE